MERRDAPVEPIPRIWAVSDGRAGNARQAAALARALAAAIPGGASMREIVLAPRSRPPRSFSSMAWRIESMSKPACHAKR